MGSEKGLTNKQELGFKDGQPLNHTQQKQRLWDQQWDDYMNDQNHYLDDQLDEQLYYNDNYGGNSQVVSGKLYLSKHYS